MDGSGRKELDQFNLETLYNWKLHCSMQEKCAWKEVVEEKNRFQLLCWKSLCLNVGSVGQSMLVLASQGRKTEFLPLLGSAELFGREKHEQEGPASQPAVKQGENFLFNSVLEKTPQVLPEQH